MKEKIQNFGLLWLRALCGSGLAVHGWMKLTGSMDSFAHHAIEPLGFPYPLVFAWAAVLSEFLGGFLMVLGLWTRLAALAAGITMGFAAFGAGWDSPIISSGGRSMELALCYLTMSVAVLCLGPGKYAVAGTKGKSGGGKKSGKKK